MFHVNLVKSIFEGTLTVWSVCVCVYVVACERSLAHLVNLNGLCDSSLTKV